MVSGRYFNRGVKSLDNPDVGYVVRETPDKIIVFGGKGNRYDIPISEIGQVGANVLVGLNYSDIVKKYKVDRNAPLPTSRRDPWTDVKRQVDLAYYEGKYPKSLFNKGVRAQNEDDLGFVVKETNDKIIVFGYSNDRYDIPKSEIIAVGMNVIIGKDFPELLNYKVDRNAPLPTGEPIETVVEEAYPEDSHNKNNQKE
jgi:sporulation protein YlmC with PRC-barrel domain